jgi:ABC-2 type transport system permease protein
MSDGTGTEATDQPAAHQPAATAPDRTGVVYDLGYAPHTGERLGRRGAVKAIVKDGFRRVLGLRRKARKKIFPWLLFAIATIPAVVFVGAAFLIADFAPDVDSPFGGHAEYFIISGTMLMLFVAVAAPELLIPDREEGVLSVYSSRPLGPLDYLGAKFAALAIVAGGFLFLPQIGMYLGFAALDDRGFASALAGNADDFLNIVLGALVYLLAYSAPGALIATYARRRGPATGVYVFIMFGSTPIAAALSQSGDFTGARYGALLALAEHPIRVTNWIFDRTAFDLVTDEAGFEPWTVLAVIVGVAVVTGIVTIRRYRRLL